jgi:hypothetical protein
VTETENNAHIKTFFCNITVVIQGENFQFPEHFTEQKKNGKKIVK